MSETWFFAGGAVVLWATLLHKLRLAHWRPREVSERALILTFLAGALVFTLALPPVYAAVDRLSGVTNSAELLIFCLAIFSGWTLQRYWVDQVLESAEGRRAIIGSAWLLIVALILMTVIFFLRVRPSLGEPITSRLIERYTDLPGVLEWNLVFIGYMGFAAYRLLRLSLASVRLLDEPHLRRRAWWYVVGWGFAIATNLHALIHTIARRFDLPLYTTPAPGVVTGGLLVACQAALLSPGLFTALDWLRDRLAQYQAHRRLYPLWRALYEATPGIAFFPARSALGDALVLRDLDLRLHHRIIEIRDGIVALRPYLHPETAEQARAQCQAVSITGEDAQAVVEAACLAVAARAKRLDLPVEQPLTSALSPPNPTFEGELRYLGKVAWAYRHSPIVARVMPISESSAKSGETRFGEAA